MTDLIVRNNQAVWGHQAFDCSIGHGGIVVDKKEGDGGTPIGAFPFREVYYRADKFSPLQTKIPSKVISPNDGWCDDPNDPQYNRHVKLPYSASHEEMWRKDHLYDLILVVGHNDIPPIPNKGSAIFVHLRRPEGTPTEGCVALSEENLLHVLRECDNESSLIVENPYDS